MHPVADGEDGEQRPDQRQASAPHPGPSHSEPVPLATMAAVNMARSLALDADVALAPRAGGHHPVSATSMIGIEMGKRRPAAGAPPLTAVVRPASSPSPSRETIDEKDGPPRWPPASRRAERQERP